MQKGCKFWEKTISARPAVAFLTVKGYNENDISQEPCLAPPKQRLPMQINRKEFLQTLGVAGAAVIGSFDHFDIFAQTGQTGAPDLVAVMGGEPDVMFQKAIAEFGGMGKFVKKGEKIVVKPNIGWSQPPEIAANTHPVLVKEIVQQIYAAGASEVIVFDTTCDKPYTDCYRKSGIEAAVKEAGGKMLPSGKEEVHKQYYKEVELPNGKILKKALIHHALIDCDAWINVPVLKVHSSAKMTIAMKNYMGIVHDPRFFHANGLQQCIADICTWEKKPVLNIVDAYRIMKANGPRGKSEADSVVVKALFAATDFVAVDTAAAKLAERFTNIPVSQVEHLVLGESMKLGSSNLETMNIKRVTM